MADQDHAYKLVIDPDRFQDGVDGPCHDAEQRRRFWTDVVSSLELSFETVFAEARASNALKKDNRSDDYLFDLEERIEKVRSGQFP
jgi:hypothetical protein